MRRITKCGVALLLSLSIVLSMIPAVPSVAKSKDKWVGSYGVNFDSEGIHCAVLNIEKMKNGKYRVSFSATNASNATCTGKVKNGVLVTKGMDGEALYVKIKIKKISSKKVKLTEIYYTDDTYKTIEEYDGVPVKTSLTLTKY